MHHRNQPVRAAGSITARYHVGDTPMDLQAADGAGAQGIGVTTGIYSREELAASSPGAARLILLTLVWGMLTFRLGWAVPAVPNAVRQLTHHDDTSCFVPCRVGHSAKPGGHAGSAADLWPAVICCRAL